MRTTTATRKPALRSRALQRAASLAASMAGDCIASHQCLATARKAETDQNG